MLIMKLGIELLEPDKDENETTTSKFTELRKNGLMNEGYFVP